MSRKVTFRQELVDNNIELSVRHLKQFFSFGHGKNSFKTKAVHDVSFDIYKGECFGLVGESGCGKTTTGRTLIRLYNATSGSVYFKGYRINAGDRWNKKEIKWSRIKGLMKIKQLKEAEAEEILKLTDSTGLKCNLKPIKRELIELKSQIKLIKDNYKFELKKLHFIEDEDEAAKLKEKAENEFHAQMEEINSKVLEANAKYRELEERIKEAEANAPKVDTTAIQGEIDAIHAKYEPQIEEIKKHIEEVRKEQKEQIAQIKYDNKHVDNKLLTKMQMVFQDPVDSLDPRMTVEDIIQEGLIIQGQRNIFKNRKKVAEALDKVGLIPEYASRYPHEFSGGQRQRIGIARALIMNPEFLICDEPISALDVSIRAQIINLLNELREEMGLTILFIAHDLSVVKYFCDRIAVMYYGNMVELATSDELFKHPLHPYTNALLSAIPKPDPKSEKVRKRIIYNPQKEHDYSKEGPKFTEIVPGHFVLANTEEIAKYKEKIKELDKKAK